MIDGIEEGNKNKKPH